ncbi:hypothetical protein ACFO3D_18210 [Virgibacillus kekensis]|uniref:Uncharacterized protein n=1 Tax=Virgibacillus kekensis TaxID=202261 RepID=A0ABV9DMX6_9BACI
MIWVIIIIIAYLPIFYRLHNTLRHLGDENRGLKAELETLKNNLNN